VTGLAPEEDRMERRRMVRGTTVWTLMALLVLAGCQEDLQRGGKLELKDEFRQKFEPYERVEYTMQENTRQVEHEEVEAAVLELPPAANAAGPVTLAAGSPLALETEAGDVLMLGISEQSPSGMLRKVVSREVLPDGTVRLETEPATLPEAFEELEIEAGMGLGDPNLPMPGFETDLNGLELRRYPVSSFIAGELVLSYDFGLNFDGTVLHDADGNHATTDDQFVMNGHITFEPFVELGVDIGYFEIYRFLIAVGLYEEVHVEIASTLAAASFEKEIVLGTMNFSPFYLGPVVVMPKIELILGVNGSLQAQISTSVTQTMQLKAGVEFLDYPPGDPDNPSPDKPNGWNPITESVFDFDFSPPTVEISAEIKGYVGPKLTLMIFGIVGPYAQINIFAKLAAALEIAPGWDFDGDLGEIDWGDWDLTPWVKLSMGIEAFVGVMGEIFGIELFDWHSDDLLGLEWTLFEWAPETCTPDCTGLECGPDLTGCALCGTCDIAWAEVCLEGQCVNTCGDQTCQDYEVGVCAVDCAAGCGDGDCGPDESCQDCAADCGACCGNGDCADDENCASCPLDCGECCSGDGACTWPEDCYTCPQDCGSCCGNGSCDLGIGEGVASCPEDCGESCGDGVCDPLLEENGCSCKADCGACCGDGACDWPEDCGSCSQDCGNCCGNGECSAPDGENCQTCSADCGPCCGDGVCEYYKHNEKCNTCPEDCGECCGDGSCNPFHWEDACSCPEDCGECCGNGECKADETCQTCPGDCGICCGNGVCQPDLGEDSCNCLDDCPEDPDTCSPCECGDAEVNNCSCAPDCGLTGNCCPNVCFACGLCPSCGDGQCIGVENCKNCWKDCGTCCGNGECQPELGEDSCSCPDDCPDDPATCSPCQCGGSGGACDCGPDCVLTDTCCDDACDLCGSCPAVCGDDSCDPGEDCQVCPEDCGVCCGDGACSALHGEDSCACPVDCPDDPNSCSTCECGGSGGDCWCDPTCFLTGACCGNACAACGACPPECGDGECDADAGEGCGDCPEDCGECCGDDQCDAAAGETPCTCPADCPNAADACEACECWNSGGDCSCAADCVLTGDCCANACDLCGVCPEVCGNGACGLGEDCDSCPLDCGLCCGNDLCEPLLGEDSCSCPDDCPDAPDACSPCQCGGSGGGCSCAADCFVTGDCCADACASCGACAPDCGDGACNGDEDCQACPADCGDCCGDGKCEADKGEDSCACPLDCPDLPGSCSPCQCGGDGGACSCTADCFLTGSCCADACEACGACAPECGDGQCNGAETSCTCPGDCPDDPDACSPCQCGDSGGDCSCAPGCWLTGDCCPNACAFCGACAPECGDGICNGDEDSCGCPEDCPDDPYSCSACECGGSGGACGCGEACVTGGDCCPNSCDVCDACGAVCGDALCEEAKGEDPCNCPQDCGDPCDGLDCGVEALCGTSCGDCALGSTCVDNLCVSDCGDGDCNAGAGENVCTCPADCGACPTCCQDGDCVLQSIDAHCGLDGGDCAVCEAPFGCHAGGCVLQAGLSWVPIPGGSFTMGSTDFPGSQPLHTVQVLPFEMMETELSVGTCSYLKNYLDLPPQYLCSMHQIFGYDEYTTACGSDCPMNSDYVGGYADDLCALVGGRLPTEAEMEYAIRGGTTTDYFCGNDAACLDAYGWFKNNTGEDYVCDEECFLGSCWDVYCHRNVLHACKDKLPNPYGLYDIVGNVREKTADCGHPNYNGAPAVSNLPWDSDCSGGDGTSRGGAFNSWFETGHSGSREPDGHVGFRCVRDIVE